MTTSSTPRGGRSLDAGMLADASAALREANIAFAAQHPGEGSGRQPVHSVYGGAQLFSAQTPHKLASLAIAALDEFAPDAATLGAALDISSHPALATIRERVVAKLQREA